MVSVVATAPLLAAAAPLLPASAYHPHSRANPTSCLKNARRRAQPVKGAGDGSNKAQKNVVNKKKKSGKGDDSDDDEGSKAQKDLMKKKKEEEAAMRAKLGKKK